MNERTELLTKNYKPIQLITVFRSESSVTGEGQYYLESHDINESGAVMAGKPLMQETIQGMVDVFFDEKQNSITVKGMLPQNLLQFNLLPGGNYNMVWYREAEERVIHFAPQLKIPTAKAWVPAMVYKVDRKHFSVFALKTNTRPKENTKLCYAPFFNVNGDGLVCLGNAKVKMPREKTYDNLVKYWEDLFWLSEFTHVNGTDEKTVTKLQPLWKSIMAKKAKVKWSELNELKFYKQKTLKHLL